MSWRSIVAVMAALLLALPAFVEQATAQRPGERPHAGDRGGKDVERGASDNWQLLGSKRVGFFRFDRDVIDVGRGEGQFRAIALMAREGPVGVREITVVYGNDEVQRIDLHQRLRGEERSKPIELAGGARFIKRIEITARSRQASRGRSVLEVYGERVDIEPWELLGEKSVDFRTDRDVIGVGRREGRFSKIALEVSGNDVQIDDLKVFYNRGPPQDVQVRALIRAGGRTRPIDLQGGDRVISRIELVYRTRGRGRERDRATVAVYGLKADGGPPGRPRWEELGCQKVGFGADRDVIRVGRSEGRFDAIRLRVERSDVVVLSLRVVYARGAPDDFEVKHRIRAGEETRPFDLRGERRAIKQIELLYSSIPSLKGAARLCADGRH